MPINSSTLQPVARQQFVTRAGGLRAERLNKNIYVSLFLFIFFSVLTAENIIVLHKEDKNNTLLKTVLFPNRGSPHRVLVGNQRACAETHTNRSAIKFGSGPAIAVAVRDWSVLAADF